MRRILVALCVFAVMVAVSNPAAAQQIDIVDYLAVTPGQWKIEHSEDICSGDSGDGGISISTSGSYTLATSYANVSGNWIPEYLDVLQITQNYVVCLGGYDYGTGMTSIYSPPLIIPRSLSLNEPVFNGGTITTGEPYAEILMITETGLSVTTPAGTFNN